MEFDITITKQTLIEWIQVYYKKYEGMDVEVEFQSKWINDYYNEYWETTATIKMELEILGKKYPVTKTISKEEIANICKTVLSETDYNLKSFYFDTTNNKNHLEINGAVLKLQRKSLTKGMSLQRENKNFKI